MILVLAKLGMPCWRVFLTKLVCRRSLLGLELGGLPPHGYFPMPPHVPCCFGLYVWLGMGGLTFFFMPVPTNGHKGLLQSLVNSEPGGIDGVLLRRPFAPLAWRNYFWRNNAKDLCTERVEVASSAVVWPSLESLAALADAAFKLDPHSLGRGPGVTSARFVDLLPPLAPLYSSPVACRTGMAFLAKF